jgi:hypothetical protein
MVRAPTHHTKMHTMDRNEITYISNLILGDIFYKQGDAKKAKLQLHKHDKENKRYVCVDPELQGPAREKEFLQKWLKPDTRVVFLRRTQHTDIGDPTVLLPTETALAR